MLKCAVFSSIVVTCWNRNVKRGDTMTDLEKRYKKIKSSLAFIVCEESGAKIKATSERLHKYHYQPPFVFDFPGFVDFTRKEALAALDKIYKLKESEAAATGLASDRSVESVKIIAMEMLYKEFSLLQKLRRDIAEAWDHINELYEDD